MLSFLGNFVLWTACLFFSALLLSPLGRGWVIFGLLFSGSTLAGLRMLWEKLDRVERKLDTLLAQQKEDINE